MKVQNKVIVVTGGGSGMGRELVLNLLSKGALVAAVDINPTTLEETRRLSGNKNDKLATFTMNITDRSAIEALLQNSITKFGYVDGIINNAGIIQPFINVNDLSYELIQKVIDVNFYGTLYMTKTFLPHLLTRPEAHIVNISSLGGFLPFPGQSIYGATKAAVKLLTEALGAELKDTNVHVSVVFPGAVNTNIMANSGLEMQPPSSKKSKPSVLLSAKDAAQLILSGMENNRSRIFVGKDSKMLDIFYRLAPESAVKFISKKINAI